MISNLLFRFLVVGCLAARAALALDAPAYTATFFYWAYAYDFEVNKGQTTIGGRACRGISSRCSFNELLDACSGSKGGYQGSVSSGNGVNPLNMGRQLINAGLTAHVQWNIPQLVIGAKPSRTFEEAVFFVTNNLAADAGKASSTAEQTMYAKAHEALVYMQEAWLKDHHEAVRTKMAEIVPNGVRVPIKDLPEDDDPVEGVVRFAVDMANMVKVWAVEIPRDTKLGRMKEMTREIVRGYRDVRALQIGHHIAATRMIVSACYRGRSIPPHLVTGKFS